MCKEKKKASGMEFPWDLKLPPDGKKKDVFYSHEDVALARAASRNTAFITPSYSSPSRVEDIRLVTGITRAPVYYPKTNKEGEVECGQSLYKLNPDLFVALEAKMHRTMMRELYELLVTHYLELVKRNTVDKAQRVTTVQDVISAVISNRWDRAVFREEYARGLLLECVKNLCNWQIFMIDEIAKGAPLDSNWHAIQYGINISKYRAIIDDNFMPEDDDDELC